MMRIVYSREHGYMEFEGHAEYAPKGQDIVCASVSALHDTLRMHPLVKAEISADGGTSLWVDEEVWSVMIPIFDTFAQGLMAISGMYPDHVDFETI